MKTQVFNPFLLSNEYIPDGEPHVFGDRLYLFGSHDRFGGKKFCMNDYLAYSAPLDDLSDWRCDGVIFSKTQDPVNHDGKLALWAPDVARGLDGRYYLFYCLADYWQIGVAVCDSPCGQYEFYGHVRDADGTLLGRRPGDTMPFDPAVLVDDDGRVYLFFGNGPLPGMERHMKNRDARCVELAPDMLTMIGQPQPSVPTLAWADPGSFNGHEMFEASSIRKFNGKYYFIYSSVLLHELCYAISDQPLSGYIYGGTLVSNGDIGFEGPVAISFRSKPNPAIKNYIGNNHGSVAAIGNDYYVFYHRQTNRHMYSRQACAEKIEMLADGSFRQAELTSCGLNGRSLAGRGVYEARIACHLMSAKGALFSVHPMVQNKKHPAFTQDGPDREENGNQYIANMRDGALAGFRYFDIRDLKSIAVTVRGKGRGKFVVKNEPNGKALAEIPVQPSGVWTKFTAAAKADDGVQALYFVYEGRGAADFYSFELA